MFLLTIVICALFNYIHFDNEVISHCGYYFHFPDDLQYWVHFHVAVDNLHFLFENIQFIVHFFIGFYI